MRPLVLVLMLALSAPAAAEVYLDDSTVEVSLEYAHEPVRFPGQFEPMIATGLAVSDRNGVFGRFIVRVLDTPSTDRDSPYVTTAETRVHHFLGGGYVETTRYHTSVRKGYETEEDRIERHKEKMQRRSQVLGLNHYTMEFRVWTPYQERSAATGAALGLSSALFRLPRFSMEAGLRWQYLRADVCGTELVPERCTSKFLGIPVTVSYSLGRLGRLDAGIAWNWRGGGVVGNHANLTPVHAGLTVDLLERVFVRGRVLGATHEITRPGFAVEIGGRL